MKVREAERPYLSAEAMALATELPEGSALRAACVEVADAARAGEVPSRLEPTAGDVVSMALETGRARSVHGPAGERALVTLWRETPRGREALEGASELNEALSALRGFPIGGVRVTPTGPSSYAISISAGDCDVNLSFDHGSARLRSINVGGGGSGE